jgi:rhodanese-related sulfurtransferase
MKTLRAAAFVAALFLAAPFAMAQDYQYISPAELKQRLQSADKPLLIDIQVEGDYAKHHLPGAVATYAYPAKTSAEQAKLAPLVETIKAAKGDVVIVCPGGGSGAKNTVDFLKSQGVAESKLRILEKGQKGWPYAELVQSSK